MNQLRDKVLLDQFKKVAKIIINKLGYKISKNTHANLMFPVEATQVERNLISDILAIDEYGFVDEKKRLSMVSVARLWSVISAVKYVVENSIPGDLIECGVWKGGCAIAMATTLKALNSQKKIYLYDTFSGMTEPGEYDVETLSGVKLKDEYIRLKVEQQSEYVNWGYDEFTLEMVKSEFEKRELLEYVVFVQGDVRKTLANSMTTPKNLSLLRLDTDWYDTTKHELNTLFPLLSERGVLLVDDYGHYDGARKAVDDFMAQLSKRPLQWVTDSTGRGYIV